MGSEEQPSAEKSFPTVGRWLVTNLPRGWVFVAGFGVRQMVMELQAVPASIALAQDELPDADLKAYFANQSRLIMHHLINPMIAGPQLTTFPGAAEAWLCFVKHTSHSGQSMLHAQTYVRQENWVGIVTLTTPEAQLQAVRADYDGFVKGLRITAT